MSKSSRKLNKKKEKAAKVDTHRRGAGLREQMKEQMEAGDYAEALGSLAELIKDNSYDPDLLYDGAYCYFMVGDYERAVRWVDMVMDLAPYHIPARILLARLCILNEREESALAMSDALLAGSRDMLTEDQAQDLNDILEYYYRCEPERIRSEYPHVAEFVAGCPEENIPVFEELPGTAAAGRNRAAWEEVAMEEPVTEEQVEAARQAVIASVQDTIDEIMAKLEAGTPWADLVAEYSTDPGMSQEPYKTNGYEVYADSSVYDPAFVQAAFSIDNVGDVSAPYVGMYGIYIVHYTRDVPSGPVELTEELRASIENELLSTQQAEALDAAFEAWKDAAGIEYTEAGEAYRPAASESPDEAADIGD